MALQNSSNGPKVAVFVFGRFNPPTKGHEFLFDAANELAVTNSADFIIFPSPTQGGKTKKINNNPLMFQEKLKFLRDCCPDYTVMDDDTIRHAHDVIDWLTLHQYTHAHMVVGSDRVEEFTRRWLPYATKHFDECSVIGVGNRNDSGQVSQMSATAARTAAQHNNIDDFRQATGWSDPTLYQLFDLVKTRMEITSSGRE